MASGFGRRLAAWVLFAGCLSDGFAPPLCAEEPRESATVRVSFGHEMETRTTITPRLIGGSPGVEVEAATLALTVGAGAVEAVTARVTWVKPTEPTRKPHSIWEYLLDHGEPGQVARLKDDPGLTAGAPVLTVLTAEDGTRGFSVGLEQLVRHEALWIPGHGAFVTLGEAPASVSEHLASLKGERVLERVKRAPEATLSEWRSRWSDFGDPNRWNEPWETSWLGTRGHLTGLVARHGSLYKFGVDRWGSVRPDHASPHRFRLDALWPGCRWTAQRIVDGLPVIVTILERNDQRCEVEQLAAPLGDGPPAKRGEIPSVLLTRIRLTGAGPVRMGFRLATENQERHPELREVAGRPCVVDRETGAVWLMIEPMPGLDAQARAGTSDDADPRLEFDCVGRLAEGETRTVVLKLASPAAAEAAIPLLASMDFDRARAATVTYWEDWIARAAHFEVPEKAVNDLFRASLWHALMLPRHRTSENGAPWIDLPYSNFAYGQLNADWPINQAVYVDYMIYGLRGYDSVAEEELAAMLRSQQKPDGRIGGYADWGVYSPGMLYAIGKNFLLSRDRESFGRLLPRAVKTLHWCLEEVERARTSEESQGLVVAPLNDLTQEARAWAFPNAYFVAGLDVFGRALEAYGHPEAAVVLQTAEALQTDVERAFARASVKSPVVQLADGTWSHYVPCDAMTPRRLLDLWYPTDVDVGPLHLARLAAVDPRGWLTTAMLDDHEDNLFLNQWGMANEPVYNPQATAYLRRDEPEAAIRAFYSMMACAFSHGQLSPLEHRWAWGQYYGPPSTDGAWFELYRNMLLNELGEGLTIGQAVPRAWLAPGRRIVIERAPTCFGPVNLRIESAVGTGSITATVEFTSGRRPPILVVRLRHPENRKPRLVTVNGAVWTDYDAAKEWVRIPDPREQRYRIVARY